MALFFPFPLSSLFFLLHLLTSFLLTISPHAILVEEKDRRRVLPEGKRREKSASLGVPRGRRRRCRPHLLFDPLLPLSSLNSASGRRDRDLERKSLFGRRAWWVLLPSCSLGVSFCAHSILHIWQGKIFPRAQSGNGS